MINLDVLLQPLNHLVNGVYGDLEKNEDKEDYPFSLLKLGLIIWRNRVFQRNRKLLLKTSKMVLRQLLKLIKNEMIMKAIRATRPQKIKRQGSDVSLDDFPGGQYPQDYIEGESDEDSSASPSAFRREQKKKDLVKVSLGRLT